MCQLTSINTSYIGYIDENIPELGISMWCIEVMTELIHGLIVEQKTLTIGCEQMDVLSDLFECEIQHIAVNLAGMVITDPRFNRKLVVNEDYAENWHARAFYYHESHLPERKVYTNDIVLKLDWAE